MRRHHAQGEIGDGDTPLTAAFAHRKTCEPALHGDGPRRNGLGGMIGSPRSLGHRHDWTNRRKAVDRGRQVWHFACPLLLRWYTLPKRRNRRC